MPKSPDDEILDSIIEAQAYLSRYQTVSDDEYAKALQELRDSVSLDLLTNSESRRNRARALESSVNRELDRIYGKYTEDLEGENEVAAAISYRATNRGFKAGLNMSAVPWTRIPDVALKSIIALNVPIQVDSNGKSKVVRIDKEVNKLSKDHKEQYLRTLRRSIGEGLSEDAAVSDFIERVGKVDNIKIYNIRALTRTAMHESMHRAQEYSEDTNFADVIEGYQWISVFDNRTTFICASQAGEVRKNRSDFRHGPPPIHINCRSRIVPVTDRSVVDSLTTRARWFDERKGTSRGELRTYFDLESDKTVTVPTYEPSSKYSSFDAWFKGLSEKRQVQYLGPQKFKLYRDGNLGTKDLITGSGRIKTVDELARLVGVDQEGLREIKRRDIPAYKPKISRTAQRILNERN